MNKFKKVLFYILSFTWGLPMTLMGLFGGLFLMAKGIKPKRFNNNIYFEVGSHWGGLEAGMFFFTDTTPSLHTKQHEAGHGIQNIIFGFFMPFVVSIPSAIRYWYRIYMRTNHPEVTLSSYDSIWFEGWATRLGEKYFPEDINNF